MSNILARACCIAVAAMLAGLAAWAGKPDPSTRAVIAMGKRQAVGSVFSASRGEDGTQEDEDLPSPYVSVIMQIDSEETVGELEQLGAIIWRRRADLLLVSIPREAVDEAIALGGVANVSATNPASAQMDVARPYCQTGAAQAWWLQGQGDELDGGSVVAGFSDNGFDANHIAFRGRVAAFYDYDVNDGVRHALLTPAEISAYGTDDVNSFHATHVGNILAGGYKGSPYYGMATGAEIVATTSNLESVGILCGVEDVIAEAKARGKRAVVNLSLSHSTGPHDGTDLLCRYLSMCAEDAVICVSAGNYGQKAVSIQKRFERDGEIAYAIVNNSKTWDGFEVAGLTEFWSLNDRPFSLRLEVFDKQTRQSAYVSPWIGAGCEADSLSLSSDECAEWGALMQGEAEAAAGLCDLNNRYCIAVGYDFATEAVWDKGPWARYYLCLAVRADAGVEIQGFTDAGSSFFGNADGLPSLNPGPELSINDMATARNVISVGACSTRNTAPQLGSEAGYTADFPLNCAAPFSSYGLGLPVFCAPGNFVVSALSSPYYEAHPEALPAAVSNVAGRDYYWIRDCGTSMASPYAAGAIALWLQANPELSVEEIIDIAKSTANRDFADISDPRWGAGCIDVLAGLQQAVKTSAVSPPTAEPVLAIVTDDRRLELHSPSAAGQATLATVVGQQVPLGSILAPGVYILRIPGHAPQKIHVR